MRDADSELDGPLSRLSNEALRSAATLDVDDVETVSDHLYTFNSMPLTPRWTTRFPDSRSILESLGLGNPTRASVDFQTQWIQAPAGMDNSWLVWVRPEASGDLRGSETDLKLYVSPHVDDLDSVFPEVVRAATYARADCIKVGAHVAGLLRPDKLVVYFSTMGDLVEAAHSMARRLEGVPAHGVPFTAEISNDGLISWSRDPPRCRSISVGADFSWREWICLRLATTLVDSRREAEGSDALCRLALEQLRADGVDTSRWSPTPSLWRRTGW